MTAAGKWLVLVPTALERSKLEFTSREDVAVELCGFGPIVSAARTSQLISQVRPDRIMLVGIAGSCRPDVETGRAFQFRSVIGHGVGIGEGEHHISPTAAGWSLLDGHQGLELEINLTVDEQGGDSIRNQIRTVCSVPANEVEAKALSTMYPNADAEDMESFGVAVAGQLAGIPLTVVRGISNRVGNRDHSSWQVEQALAAANELATQILGVTD